MNDEKKLKGMVYILTNPSFDGWIKIGQTTDVKKRIKDLSDKTSVPLSYRLYATYRTNKFVEVETVIHNLIDTIDSRLRSQELDEKGKIIRRREFFHTTPEKAFKIFKEVAKLLDESEKVKLFEPTEEQQKEEEIIESIKKQPKFTFKLLDIPVGSKLTFINDETKVVVTLNDERSVSFNDKETVLSEVARELLGWKRRPQGTNYFLYKGETLVQRRERLSNLYED